MGEGSLSSMLVCIKEKSLTRDVSHDYNSKMQYITSPRKYYFTCNFSIAKNPY